LSIEELLHLRDLHYYMNRHDSQHHPRAPDLYKSVSQTLGYLLTSFVMKLTKGNQMIR